jgi:hypothetical protein
MQGRLIPLKAEVVWGGFRRLTNLSALADAQFTKSLQLSGKGFGSRNVWISSLVRGRKLGKSGRRLLPRINPWIPARINPMSVAPGCGIQLIKETWNIQTQQLNRRSEKAVDRNSGRVYE